MRMTVSNRPARRVFARALQGMVLVCAFVVCAVLPGMALAEEPQTPELAEADAAILVDQEGNVLFERNADAREHPASITKVMTAMVVLDSNKSLSDVVVLTQPDLGENSQMGDYGDGDTVPLEELLRVMLVYSGNDAAYNAAVYVAGSEEAFVDLMNQKAKEIGMKATHFANSHGLEDDNHYSCARDLALMARYALQHYPFIAQTALWRNVSTTVRGYPTTLESTDRLLETFYGIRGIKTGAIIGNYTFLGAAGRGDVQLYCAVLGCPTFTGRFDDAAALMEWGFQNYARRSVPTDGWIVDTPAYADDFLLRSPIVVDGDTQLTSWPHLNDFEGTFGLSSATGALLAGTPYGWCEWRQAGSLAGIETYRTQETPVMASSWPIFEQPLFQNAT